MTNINSQISIGKSLFIRFRDLLTLPVRSGVRRETRLLFTVPIRIIRIRFGSPAETNSGLPGSIDTFNDRKSKSKSTSGAFRDAAHLRPFISGFRSFIPLLALLIIHSALKAALGSFTVMALVVVIVERRSPKLQIATQSFIKK